MSSEEGAKRKPGRPKGTGHPERRTSVHVLLDDKTVAWASQQPGGISATVRRCLESMQAGGQQQKAQGQ